jgi:hypothetical protein
VESVSEGEVRTGFTNDRVLGNISGVLEEIKKFLPHPFQFPSPLMERG